MCREKINLQHKQTWRRVNVTQSTETRGSYLKEGLLRSHGRGLGMKSLTRTRKPSSAKYTAGSNTTNLFYHLRKNHVKQYRESLRMRPKKVQSSAQNKPTTQMLQEAFARGTPYGKESRRWKEIRAAVTTYICKDMAPIYTVEKRGFCELILTLDPRYQMQIPFIC